MSLPPMKRSHSDGPQRFVLVITTLIYAVVALCGIALLMQPRVDADGRQVAIGTTVLITVVAVLALVTNVFAWLGTSRGERLSAAVSSVAFAILTLFGLWPMGLVIAPFPLLNALFLYRAR